MDMKNIENEARMKKIWFFKKLKLPRAYKGRNTRLTLHLISTTCHHLEQATSPFLEQVLDVHLKWRDTPFSPSYK